MKSILSGIFLFLVFAAQGQSLTSITPSTGAAGTSVTVTITGSGTSFTNSTIFFLSSGASILSVSNVVASSSTSVQATVAIPANATSGAYNLTTLAGIVPISLTNAFTVTGGGGAGASIVSVDPNEGYAGQFLSVTITGTNTAFTESDEITATMVKGLGTPIASLGSVAMDDSTLMVYFGIPMDAALGSYTLALTTSNNGILTKSNAFTVVENPMGELVEISPDHGNKDETLDVTISGSGTSFTQASTVTVEFYGSVSGSMLTVNSTTIVNDSTLVCNVTISASARSGAYDVFVVLGEGFEFLQLTEGFTVIGDPGSDPRIVSVSPSTAQQGEVLDVTITGTNTRFSESPENHMAAIFLQATYIEASSFSVLNDSEMTAHFEIPIDFETGLYDFGVVTDGDGYLDLVQSFTIIEPNTGIHEAGRKNGHLVVYPNPVKDLLVFESTDKVSRVMLTDVSGKQTEIPLAGIRQQQSSFSLNIGQYGLAKGIYLLVVETEYGIKYQRFMKN